MRQLSKEKRNWHFGRVIDAPMLVMLLFQTLGVIWYGAQLVKTVELQGSQIAELTVKVNRMVETQRDAIAPFATMTARLAILEQELAVLRTKVYR